MHLRNQAMHTELGQRADQIARERAQLRIQNSVIAPSANAHDRLGANAQFGIRERTRRNHSSSNNLTPYKCRYREDTRRIEHKLRVSELGIRKPTAQEKRITSRTRSYLAVDYDAVLERKKTLNGIVQSRDQLASGNPDEKGISKLIHVPSSIKKDARIHHPIIKTFLGFCELLC